MSGFRVRTFVRGEEEKLLEIIGEALGPFVDPTQPKRVMSSEQFDPDACFIAEETHSPLGCVALTSLPREKWYVVRYLAARPSSLRTQVAEKLVNRVLEYAESQEPEYLRATTPAIQPYVNAYKHSGFQAVRRDFRITWDLDKSSVEPNVPISLKPVTQENSQEAAATFVGSLAPIWDWRTAEQGGKEAVKRFFREKMTREEQYFLGQSKGRTVGLVGIILDYYKPGEARFRGAFVLPENRGRGIGTALMNEIERLARAKAQRKMTVFTFSYLDSLAPGALLYLRSGGKIDAEYLQLERGVNKVSGVN